MNFLKIVFLFCFIPIFAQADVEVREITLKNGMRILVKEDHRAPVVVSMVWYRAGSLDEGKRQNWVISRFRTYDV